ncbi:uncharacterized protein M437DRAFT_85410 [Aureobasidium melanogenum CBS 110374]|uniref:Uncharacterized protein n=1 Tax=Aureobasidium melanogenum (strain CBS 110374) TaxID=1043003 RepID=A0A074VMM8_AURM1|nr:uncharacterized protein M437DRAFT_85410 [Aureobasidium melanogenum CBS 110374]KEQ61980.1 hypothetical protein M437DRAFT_85410 [Aureobasidium melanogenum CBS 110374]
MFSPLAIQTITRCAAQAQAMERVVVGENVSLVPRHKLDKKVKTAKTTKGSKDGKNENLCATQKDQTLRQQVPAPPLHVLTSRRATYFANVLTASIFCINNSQHFCNFTVESQEQWTALLESYKDVRYRKFTPAYEEVPDILERLRTIKFVHCSSANSNEEKHVEQSHNIANSNSIPSVASTQRRAKAKVNSHQTMPPPADVTLPSEPTQAFRRPESMKQLPRLTPQSFRQQIRNQGLEGIFVEFVPFASLAESNPAKRYKEHLEQHGMAGYVEWVVPGSGWH